MAERPQPGAPDADPRAGPQELETQGGDPANDDTEGRPSEDRVFGGGSHGWYDRLVARLRRI